MSLNDKLKKLERIAEGWKNVVFLSPSVEELAKGRADICAQCVHCVPAQWLEGIDKVITKAHGMKCDICNCPICAKTRSVKEICPLNKW